MKELIIEKRNFITKEEKQKSTIYLLLVRRSIKVYSYFVFAENRDQVLTAYIETFCERPSEKVVNIIDIDTIKRERWQYDNLMNDLINKTKAFIFFDVYRNIWQVQFYLSPCMSKFNLYKDRYMDILFLSNTVMDSFYIEKLKSILVASKMIKREDINSINIPVIDNRYYESIKYLLDMEVLDWSGDVNTNKYVSIIVDSNEIQVDKLVELWNAVIIKKKGDNIKIDLMVLCKDNLLELVSQKDEGFLFVPLNH